MRFITYSAELVVLATTAFAQGCPRVTSLCASQTAATAYCSTYIHAPASPTATIRNTITISTVTVYAPYVYTSTTVNACPTKAPTSLAKRSPGDPAHEGDLFARGTGIPQCLQSYNVTNGQLSSACHCFQFPAATTVTRRRDKTTTLPNAPTISVTNTYTLTSERATPSCVVTDQPSNGPAQTWKRTFAYCDTDASAAETGFIYTFNNMTICEALNWCAASANSTTKPSLSFEVSYQVSDESQIWYCTSYSTQHPDFVFDYFGVGDPQEIFGYALIGG